LKTFIFFDLDRTIYNTKLKEVPSQTIKLLKRLKTLPNVYLGIATGRNISKVKAVINDLLDIFDYQIFINGALGFHQGNVIVDKAIKKADIIKVVNKAEKFNAALGFVGSELEYITHIDNYVESRIASTDQSLPKILKNAYDQMEVYQLWLFTNKEALLEHLLDDLDLQSFFWHTGGVDIIRNDVSKSEAIKKLLEKETNYRLITVGDGHNDISMIELADVGIAMGNSTNEELKKKADYIAPDIDDNQLYDFFKTIFSDLTL